MVWKASLLLVLLAATQSALADGIVLPRVLDPAAVTIPDQQALISFADGVQTLAIETRFDADGGADFAWLVPAPSEPRVTAGTTGTFPTLQAVFAPRVLRTAGFPVVTIAGVLLAATGLAAAFLPRTLARSAFIAVGLFFLAAMSLLPALGSARGITAGPGLEVLDRSLVGTFDVAVLKAGDGQALTAWLDENGFAMPPGARSAVQQYVSEGWCFVAAKVRRDLPGPATPHPLVMTFAAKEPVYPMRLTAAAIDKPLALHLYVFGPQRAAAPGMKVERCGAIGPGDDHLELQHAALVDLTEGARFATKLVGDFSTKQAEKDIVLAWDGDAPYRRTVVPKEERGLLSISVAMLALGGAAWIAAVLRKGVISSTSVPLLASTRPHKVFGALLLTAGIAGGVAFSWFDAVPTLTGKRRWPIMSDLYSVAQGVVYDSDRVLVTDSTLLPESAPGQRLAAVRELVATALAHADHRERLGSLRHEDSPGNYIIRERGPWIELIAHGLDGREHGYGVLWTGEGEAPRYKPLFEN